MIQEKLESLDELILNRVFEPITQYAHKKMGWTKYDLAAGCFQGAGAAALGSGLYQIMCTAEIPLFLVSGSLFTLLGLVDIAIVPEWKKINEKNEQDLYVKTGAVRSPKLKASRPIDFLGLYPFVTSFGVQVITDATEKNNYLFGLGVALLGISGITLNTQYLRIGSTFFK